MTEFGYVGWIFASASLLGASIFFWLKEKLAGFAFIVVFIVVLAGASEKRIVLTSALLGLTLESEKGSRSSGQ